MNACGPRDATSSKLVGFLTRSFTRLMLFWGCLILASLTVSARFTSDVLGLDLSGSLQGAGGVGGLLAVTDVGGSATHFVGHDGNGNVGLLVNAADGAVSGRYEYGPFGETIRVTGGAIAQANPFRFSTKLADEFTGLTYYGYRDYNPSTGRWLSRDPLGEEGGLNLYGFVSGDPLNRINALGQFDFDFGVFGRGVRADSIAVGQRLGRGLMEMGSIGYDMLAQTAWAAGGAGGEYQGVSQLYQNIYANPNAYQNIQDDILRGTIEVEKNIATLGLYGLNKALNQAIDCDDYTGLQDEFAGLLLGGALGKGIQSAPRIGQLGRRFADGFGDSMQASRAGGFYSDPLMLQQASRMIRATGSGVKAALSDSAIAARPTVLPRGFSNVNFGEAVHQRFRVALSQQTGTRARDWLMRTSPGQRGVDATYIGPSGRFPGFGHAELKPNSPGSISTFGNQLGNWNLPPGQTQLWLYNQNGVIGSSGFNF